MPLHKALHDQIILHGNLNNGGNTFFTESLQDHIYGFSADLDLASVNDAALEGYCRYPEGTKRIEISMLKWMFIYYPEGRRTHFSG